MDSALSEVASPRRLWAWAIFIALAGVAARALWYFRFKDDLPVRLGPNGDIYIAQAHSFLNGAIGNTDATGLASAYEELFAPGYGLFLAGIWQALPRGDVFNQTETALMAVFATQWVIAGMTTLMTFALARRVLFGFTALIPPAIITLSVALADLPNMFAYETLLLFLLTATVLLLVKSHDESLEPLPGGLREDTPASGNTPGLNAMLAGLALSFAILVQPRVALLLPFAAWWLLRASRGRHAVIFLFVALLLPAGWVARDYSLYNTVAPIAIGPQESMYLDNVDPLTRSGFVAGATPVQCPRDVLFTPNMGAHFAWGRCMQRAGAEAIADHPADSALALPTRLAALFSVWNPQFARGQYSSDRWGYQDLVPQSLAKQSFYDSAKPVLAVVFVAIYVLLMLAGLYGLWLEGTGSPARMIALPVLVLPLAHLLFHAENRFRVPLLPFIAIAITLGSLILWDAFRQARTRE